MILTAISFLLPYASAIDFTFTSPDEVAEDEEFEVSITASTTDIYDVKIFVTNEIGKYGRGNIVSEVYYNGQWKDPWIYLDGAFPGQTSFQNKVINFSGETEICVRLRLDVEPPPAYDGFCQPINVNGNSGNSNSNNGGGGNEDESTEEENNDQDTSENPTTSNTTPVNTLLAQQPAPAPKKIVLNAPAKNEKIDERSEVTKEQKVRTWVIYGFVFLCVILIVLLALKKL